MRKLSKYEKETIINWNEAENLASIYTFNASLKRRLADFSRKYPLLCRLERSTPEGSVTYVLDKSRLSIRLVPPYSEERKAAAREYAKGAWLSGGDERKKKSPEIGAITVKMPGLHPAVLTGNPRRRIPYPLPADRRKCADTEPVKLAETPLLRWKPASPVREYRGRQALCAWVQGRQRTAGVKGQRPLGGYRAAAPVRSVEAASLYSGVQRWKTSAQGKLMPASTRTGYYLTQNSQDLRLRRPFPGPSSIFAGRRKSV